MGKNRCKTNSLFITVVSSHILSFLLFNYTELNIKYLNEYKVIIVLTEHDVE